MKAALSFAGRASTPDLAQSGRQVAVLETGSETGSFASPIDRAAPAQGRRVQLSYMPQLDGLRALAVLAVLYTHLSEPKYWLFGIYWGGLGVRLFFVLSGYLITRILLDLRARIGTGELSAAEALRTFYVRRLLRLAPAYYLVLLLTAVLGVPRIRESLLWHASYLSNFYFVGRGGLDELSSHFWTLAVEEQFYVLWSLAVLVAPTRWLVPLMGTAVAAGPLYRLAVRLAGGGDVLSVLLPGSLDTLGLGALLGWSTSRGKLPPARGRRLLTGGLLVGLLLLSFSVRETGETPGLASFVLKWPAAGLVFVWVVARSAVGFQGLAGRVLASRPLVALGRISYGIYVFHNFVPYFLTPGLARLGVRAPWAMTLLGSVATIALAGLSWQLVEVPANRLKERLSTPNRRGTAPDARK